MKSITRRGQRGYSLVEVAIAAAIFLFVMMAAYATFNESNKVYKSGTVAAEMQQRTRLAFDQVLDELRLAGFDFNRDGEENVYPDQSDEQIEYMGAHAIAFRGNLDFEDADGGRESDYEDDPTSTDYGTVCCPIVTTANDEIVVYALRSDDDAANDDTITLTVDTSMPRNGVIGSSGLPTGEETVTIDDVDLSVDHPPYTLVRFHLADDGTVTERPIATDVRSLTFTYEGGDGTDYYCSTPATDGTCPTGGQVAFEGLGGADDLTAGDGKGRDGRASVRRIHAELVGMTELDDPRYTDPDDSLMPHRRKMLLESTIVPQNLGLKGRPDIADEEVESPQNVTVCTGQCNTIRVEWDAVSRGDAYRVKLYLANASVAFFEQVTPGITVPGSSPERVYAIYQRSDDGRLVTGTQVFATVEARTLEGKFSPRSDPSLTVTLRNVARISAPERGAASGFDPHASGWPDVVENGIFPDTTNASNGYGAQSNQITVSWLPPQWALDVTDQANPSTTWTTLANGSAQPALDCDSEPVDAANPSYFRTRARFHTGNVRYYVFRSENSRFVPTATDLVGEIAGQVDSATGRVSFVDTSLHLYSNGVFNNTPNALVNCKTYWYRVRAVSECYTGGKANAHRLDRFDLSPFHPALNPDPDADDTDDLSGVSPSQVGLALPGFAIPQALPLAPFELRLKDYDRVTTDGDGRDVMIAFDAVKQDSTVIVNPDSTTTPAYDDIAIDEYRLYSHPSDPNFGVSSIDSPGGGVRLDKTIRIQDVKAGRIDRDDENGNGNIGGGEDESVPPGSTGSASPNSGLRLDLVDTSQRFYRLLAIQCREEPTVPSTSEPAAYDVGRLSSAVKFPCEFGGGQFSTVTCDATNFPTSVTGTALVQELTQPAVRARLVLVDKNTGDRTISPAPGLTVPASGIVTFGADHIASLTDHFGRGAYMISVEMTDSLGCLGFSNDQGTAGSLPSCCLVGGSPKPTIKPAANQLRTTVIESCGVTLRVHRITISIDNLNGGAAERAQAVLWGTTTIWTGNTATVVIDRASNPLVIGPYGTQLINTTLNRDALGDNVSVTLEYRVGGRPGSCTFTNRI